MKPIYTEKYVWTWYNLIQKKFEMMRQGFLLQNRDSSEMAQIIGRTCTSYLLGVHEAEINPTKCNPHSKKYNLHHEN